MSLLSKGTLIIRILGLSAVSLLPRVVFAEPAKYKIYLNLRTPLHASVEAELDVPDRSLFTAKHAGGYAWWDFIKNLRQIRDDNSTSLPIASDAPGHWSLPHSSPSRLHLAYDVDLSFAEKVRNGDLRGGLLLSDSLYLVNKALFIMSNAPGGKSIEFDVPSSFIIATPWIEIADHHFQAADNRELTENWTILGRFPVVNFRQDNFQVTFAFPGVGNEEESLLKPLFGPVLREYLRIFPQTPATHLFFAFFHGAEDNGEGFLSSTTLTMSAPITRNNRILWTNLLAHEVFHHWNGGLLSPREDEKTSWFSEGVTEYMANRTISRAGLISTDLFIRLLETHVAMYDYWMWAPPFQKTTLESAGADKDLNRPAVYSGGVVAAFCLDKTIQKQTSGTKTLEDLLQLMMKRYGLTGKQWVSDYLVKDASEVAGADLSEFFARYISDRRRLPVESCLTEAGFDAALSDYAGEAFVTLQEHPSTAARLIRERLLYQNER